MNCLICNESSIKLLSAITGLDDRNYEIFHCADCDSNFTQPTQDIKSAYNKAYEREKFSSGYDKYFEIFNDIKNSGQPLEFLLGRQPLYLPVKVFLQDKQSLDILEIGCGLGYLTYALNQAGHCARGIDISSQSIDLAREKFGDNYENCAVEYFSTVKKYDLIVATELIEHLKNPADFLEKCGKLLKDGGAIIITTPNKDYYGKAYIWNTELPPLHLSWIGAQGLRRLINRSKFNFDYFNYFKHGVGFQEKNNLLTDYFVSRNITFKDFYPVKENSLAAKSRRSWLKIIFVECRTIRLISNIIFSLFFRANISKYVIISVILIAKE